MAQQRITVDMPVVLYDKMKKHIANRNKKQPEYKLTQNEFIRKAIILKIKEDNDAKE